MKTEETEENSPRGRLIVATMVWLGRRSAWREVVRTRVTRVSILGGRLRRLPSSGGFGYSSNTFRTGNRAAICKGYSSITLIHRCSPCAYTSEPADFLRFSTVCTTLLIPSRRLNQTATAGAPEWIVSLRRVSCLHGGSSDVDVRRHPWNGRFVMW